MSKSELIFHYDYEHSLEIPFNKLNDYGVRTGLISNGTYGKVYKYVKNANEVFAIKIYPKLSFDFLIEMMILKRLKHPNIIKLIDIIIDKDSTIGIVEELVYSDFVNIRKRLYFSPTQLDSFAYQMISAVSYIHKCNIIHRDIKPGNFLFRSPNTVLLADFGMAHPFASKSNALYIEEIYSLWYRPPEIVFDSNAKYGTSADIWALALTIWELYTGKPLFSPSDETMLSMAFCRAFGSPKGDESWINKPKNIPDEIIPAKKGKLSSYYINSMLETLLGKVIIYDPQKRLTADQMINDEYFNDITKLSNNPPPPKSEPCLHLQKRDRCPKNYMKQQPFVTEEHRLLLINWLVQCVFYLDLDCHIFWFATILLDEVTPLINPPLEKYQLLGMGCLTLADQILNSEAENTLHTFISLTNAPTVTISKLKKMRKKILRVLNGDLLFTIPYHYLSVNNTMIDNGLFHALLLVLSISQIRLQLTAHSIFLLVKRLSIPLDNDASFVQEIEKSTIEEMVPYYRKLLKNEMIEASKHAPFLIDLFDMLSKNNPTYMDYATRGS